MKRLKGKLLRWSSIFLALAIGIGVVVARHGGIPQASACTWVSTSCGQGCADNKDLYNCSKNVTVNSVTVDTKSQDSNNKASGVAPTSVLNIISGATPTPTPAPQPSGSPTTCATGWSCKTACADTATITNFTNTWCDGKSRWLYEAGCGGSQSSLKANGCVGAVTPGVCDSTSASGCSGAAFGSVVNLSCGCVRCLTPASGNSCGRELATCAKPLSAACTAQAAANTTANQNQVQLYTVAFNKANPSCANSSVSVDQAKEDQCAQQLSAYIADQQKAAMAQPDLTALMNQITAAQQANNTTAAVAAATKLHDLCATNDTYKLTSTCKGLSTLQNIASTVTSYATTLQNNVNTIVTNVNTAISNTPSQQYQTSSSTKAAAAAVSNDQPLLSKTCHGACLVNGVAVLGDYGPGTVCTGGDNNSCYQCDPNGTSNFNQIKKVACDQKEVVIPSQTTQAPSSNTGTLANGAACNGSNALCKSGYCDPSGAVQVCTDKPTGEADKKVVGWNVTGTPPLAVCSAVYCQVGSTSCPNAKYSDENTCKHDVLAGIITGAVNSVSSTANTVAGNVSSLGKAISDAAAATGFTYDSSSNSCKQCTPYPSASCQYNTADECKFYHGITTAVSSALGNITNGISNAAQQFQNAAAQPIFSGMKVNGAGCTVGTECQTNICIKDGKGNGTCSPSSLLKIGTDGCTDPTQCASGICEGEPGSKKCGSSDASSAVLPVVHVGGVCSNSSCKCQLGDGTWKIVGKGTCTDDRTGSPCAGPSSCGAQNGQQMECIPIVDSSGIAFKKCLPSYNVDAQNYNNNKASCSPTQFFCTECNKCIDTSTTSCDSTCQPRKTSSLSIQKETVIVDNSSVAGEQGTTQSTGGQCARGQSFCKACNKCIDPNTTTCDFNCYVTNPPTIQTGAVACSGTCKTGPANAWYAPGTACIGVDNSCWKCLNPPQFEMVGLSECKSSSSEQTPTIPAKVLQGAPTGPENLISDQISQPGSQGWALVGGSCVACSPYGVGSCQYHVNSDCTAALQNKNKASLQEGVTTTSTSEGGFQFNGTSCVACAPYEAGTSCGYRTKDLCDTAVKNLSSFIKTAPSAVSAINTTIVAPVIAPYVSFVAPIANSIIAAVNGSNPSSSPIPSFTQIVAKALGVPTASLTVVQQPATQANPLVPQINGSVCSNGAQCQSGYCFEGTISHCVAFSDLLKAGDACSAPLSCQSGSCGNLTPGKCDPLATGVTELATGSTSPCDQDQCACRLPSPVQVNGKSIGFTQISRGQYCTVPQGTPCINDSWCQNGSACVPIFVAGVASRQCISKTDPGYLAYASKNTACTPGLAYCGACNQCVDPTTTDCGAVCTPKVDTSSTVGMYKLVQGSNGYSCQSCFASDVASSSCFNYGSYDACTAQVDRLNHPGAFATAAKQLSTNLLLPIASSVVPAVSPYANTIIGVANVLSGTQNPSTTPLPNFVRLLANTFGVSQSSLLPKGVTVTFTKQDGDDCSGDTGAVCQSGLCVHHEDGTIKCSSSNDLYSIGHECTDKTQCASGICGTDNHQCVGNDFTQSSLPAIGLGTSCVPGSVDGASTNDGCKCRLSDGTLKKVESGQTCTSGAGGGCADDKACADGFVCRYFDDGTSSFKKCVGRDQGNGVVAQCDGETQVYCQALNACLNRSTGCPSAATIDGIKAKNCTNGKLQYTNGSYQCVSTQFTGFGQNVSVQTIISDTAQCTDASGCLCLGFKIVAGGVCHVDNAGKPYQGSTTVIVAQSCSGSSCLCTNNVGCDCVKTSGIEEIGTGASCSNAAETPFLEKVLTPLIKDAYVPALQALYGKDKTANYISGIVNGQDQSKIDLFGNYVQACHNGTSSDCLGAAAAYGGTATAIAGTITAAPAAISTAGKVIVPVVTNASYAAVGAATTAGYAVASKIDDIIQTPLAQKIITFANGIINSNTVQSIVNSAPAQAVAPVVPYIQAAPQAYLQAQAMTSSGMTIADFGAVENAFKPLMDAFSGGMRASSLYTAEKTAAANAQAIADANAAAEAQQAETAAQKAAQVSAQEAKTAAGTPAKVTTSADFLNVPEGDVGIAPSVSDTATAQTAFERQAAAEITANNTPTVTLNRTVVLDPVQEPIGGTTPTEVSSTTQAVTPKAISENTYKPPIVSKTGNPLAVGGGATYTPREISAPINGYQPPVLQDPIGGVPTQPEVIAGAPHIEAQPAQVNFKPPTQDAIGPVTESAPAVVAEPTAPTTGSTAPAPVTDAAAQPAVTQPSLATTPTEPVAQVSQPAPAAPAKVSAPNPDFTQYDVGAKNDGYGPAFEKAKAKFEARASDPLTPPTDTRAVIATDGTVSVPPTTRETLSDALNAVPDIQQHLQTLPAGQSVSLDGIYTVEPDGSLRISYDVPQPDIPGRTTLTGDIKHGMLTGESNAISAGEMKVKVTATGDPAQPFTYHLTDLNGQSGGYLPVLDQQKAADAVSRFSGAGFDTTSPTLQTAVNDLPLRQNIVKMQDTQYWHILDQLSGAGSDTARYMGADAEGVGYWNVTDMTDRGKQIMIRASEGKPIFSGPLAPAREAVTDAVDAAAAKVKGLFSSTPSSPSLSVNGEVVPPEGYSVTGGSATKVFASDPLAEANGQSINDIFANGNTKAEIKVLNPGDAGMIAPRTLEDIKPGAYLNVDGQGYIVTDVTLRGPNGIPLKDLALFPTTESLPLSTAPVDAVAPVPVSAAPAPESVPLTSAGTPLTSAPDLQPTAAQNLQKAISDAGLGEPADAVGAKSNPTVFVDSSVSNQLSSGGDTTLGGSQYSDLAVGEGSLHSGVINQKIGGSSNIQPQTSSFTTAVDGINSSSDKNNLFIFETHGVTSSTSTGATGVLFEGNVLSPSELATQFKAAEFPDTVDIVLAVCQAGGGVPCNNNSFAVNFAKEMVNEGYSNLTIAAPVGDMTILANGGIVVTDSSGYIMNTNNMQLITIKNGAVAVRNITVGF